MHDNMLLVGSVPLPTVEEVMRSFEARFGDQMAYMPDGEVGERRSWVNRLCYQIFNGHPDLETLKRPEKVDGVEQLLPRTRADAWQFAVRPGIDVVRFGNPGSRLGYARDATSSYFVFKTLREKGLVPPGQRFQISIPMVNSVVRPLYFPETADLARVRPGYEAALAAEIDAILKIVPHEDLAIQWDCAWEVQALYNFSERYPEEAKVGTHLPQIERLSKRLPAGVALGFHFCFGTFGGWPSFNPADLGHVVELVNASVEATGRRVDWVHIPALARTDDAFYAPLSGLRLGRTRIYLGLVHSMDTFAERLAAARRVVPDFGLAAYCGFGRIPPDQMPSIIEDHALALKLAGFTR